MTALPSTEALARLAAISAKLRSQDPIPSRSEIAAEIDAIREVLDRREAEAWRSVERKFYRSEWPLVPVAYQVRMSDGRWGTIFHHPDKPLGDHRPLYAHPPQPSASVVEAIATCETVLICAQEMCKAGYPVSAFNVATNALRALKGGQK